jgi:hypothetical protein
LFGPEGSSIFPKKLGFWDSSVHREFLIAFSHPGPPALPQIGDCSLFTDH